MTQKIDRRKNYYIVFDTETANGLDNPLVYDIGGAVVDKMGIVYATFSFVIYEIFCGMKDLMQSAYYAEKIPMYEKQIANGERQIVKYATAKRHIAKLAKEYNVKAMIAHNARFDYRSTATTQRYLTKSKYRFFLPYGIELWDTMKMAQDTICKQKGYVEWCKANNQICKNGQVRSKAETIYRYISGQDDFIEEHTGLADVMIEKEIFAHCIRQHKPMRKKCFK